MLITACADHNDIQTIVYMQLFVQRHNAEWYAVTHQEVHCVSLSYNNEYAANKSPPSTAKGNNEWSYTSTPHINGMHCHGFVFTLTHELKHCNLTVKNISPQCSSSLKVTGHT